ncbi:hypothetical protein Q2K19_29275 [Micromonospora soli]|uniref:hypothetical protein n=1 Tax=Micromonospora sp. NBRC 110009 TaxID=3061627 RepID=UPI0026713292|nr:hypothetical protein [Micromonospora sp. NBRC 110009]WKT98207.1 hypothetical protein Q2K19_29275 [Micromonospora sp. NBRC 110009]
MKGSRSRLVHSARNRLGRIAAVALLLAGAYGIVLVVAGFVLPVYRSETVSASGDVTPGSGTVVEVNGPGAAVVLGVPLLATALVGCALWLRSMPSAWVLTRLVAGFNLLAMASIGLFLLPVTAALIVACGTGPHPPKLQDPADQAR